MLICRLTFLLVLRPVLSLWTCSMIAERCLPLDCPHQIDCGPDLSIYFLAWPQTHHIIMNSPDNLGPFLNFATICASVLLTLLGQCGVWALTDEAPALPSLYCAQLLVPIPLWSSQPSLYPEKSTQSTGTTVASQMTLFRLQESSKYLCYISKTF